MMNFMMLGGYAMWPVLVMGLISIGFAFGFARNPLSGKPAVVKSLTIASLLTAMAGSTAGFSNTMFYIAATETENPTDLVYMAAQGLGETFGAWTLSTGLLGVAWILISVGVRRLNRKLEGVQI